MAFNVKNDEADRLLRELTSLTGETLTDATTISLRDRLNESSESEQSPTMDRLPPQ